MLATILLCLRDERFKGFVTKKEPKKGDKLFLCLYDGFGFNDVFNSQKSSCRVNSNKSNGKYLALQTGINRKRFKDFLKKS